jgi:hypothetical protein
MVFLNPDIGSRPAWHDACGDSLHRILQIPSLCIASATYSNLVVTVGGIPGGPIGTAPSGGDSDIYCPSAAELYVFHFHTA